MQNFQIKSGLAVSVLFALLGIIPYLIRFEGRDWIDILTLIAYTFIFTLCLWTICMSLLRAKKPIPSVLVRWFLASILGTAFVYFAQIAGTSILKQVANENSHINEILQLHGQRLLYMELFRATMITEMVCFIVHNVNVVEDRRRKSIEIEQLKQENLEARLDLLKQQISPHFLFNSLSTLKTIATDSKTKNYIVQLSNVYRYLLNNNILQKDNLVPLSDELAFTKSYLYILTERFEDALQVDIEVSEELMQKRLPPLALQILIENATKHNAISIDEPLKIAIYTDKHHFLVVENNLQLKHSVEDSLGLGIKNIQDRYKLLRNKEIIISETKTSFLVKLPLLDAETCDKEEADPKSKLDFCREKIKQHKLNHHSKC